MIWLPATLLAALFQAWRTAVQQRVRAELSVNAAGLVRYLYGLPVGILLLVLYLRWTGSTLPALHLPFIAFCAAAGFAQIIGTNLLLMAFGYRNYVAGTAFAKTEAIQGAVLAMGVFLSSTTKIIDRNTGEIYVGRVPAYSVVVPGALPGKPLPDGTPGPSLACAVIVKRVDAQTRSKTAINELLRD